MTRDQPVTDAEPDDVSEAIREQRDEVRAYLEAECVDLSVDVASDPDITRERAGSD